MINKEEVFKKAKENLFTHNSAVVRNPYADKELSADSKVVLETILDVMNKENEEIRKSVDETLALLKEIKEYVENYDEVKETDNKEDIGYE